MSLATSHQPTLQPPGLLLGSSEFGPHTPNLFTEISPDKKINYRRFVNIVASEVGVEYCTDEDVRSADPDAILANLILESGDPRRGKDSDPEQLVVIGRDIELPSHSEEAEQEGKETFYFPGKNGVVFGEADFRKVARAPADLAKAEKAKTRSRGLKKAKNPETEEQFELDFEGLGFKAIRAAIHTLDQYIVNMDELSSGLEYKRQQWANIYRYLSFPIYAQHKGRVVRTVWGQTDSEIHRLGDLSLINASPKLYDLSGMHRAIRNNIYNPDENQHPADALRGYINKLIKPYTRAKYEKVRIASRASTEVRNRHMEMLPTSMQGKIVSEFPEAYERPRIIPRLFNIDETTPV